MKLFLYFLLFNRCMYNVHAANVKCKYQGKHFQNMNIFFIQINQQIKLHFILYINPFYNINRFNTRRKNLFNR